MYVQNIIRNLQKFWEQNGCIILNTHDIEKGAGTMSPHTFFKVLGEKPWKAAFIECCRAPTDGKYGKESHRLYQHHQLEVILKPSPDNVQDLYLDSLKSLGIKLENHDIRFLPDNWEGKTLGGWGLGWMVEINGIPITHFTYFQQMGSMSCRPISAEIATCIEHLAIFLQGKDSIYDVMWNKDISYGKLFKSNEYQYSKYSFEIADSKTIQALCKIYENEATMLINKKLTLPAYDYILKFSNIFNILDARGLISINERSRLIARIRWLIREVAEVHISNQNS